MARQPITARTLTIGWYTDYGGKLGIANFTGTPLGTFDPKENLTRDFYGKPVGQGDHRMGLLFEDIYKRADPKELDAIKH